MEQHEKTIEELCNRLKKCHLPLVPDGEERPPDKNDFIAFTNESEKELLKIQEEMDNLVKNGNVTELLHKDFLMSLCILIGENHSHFPWNSQASLNRMKEIWELLANRLHINAEEQLLVDGVTYEKVCIRPLLRPILLQLRPKLLKSSWRKHPASVQCYVWLMNAISFPNLSEHVQEILPTALILTDDFVNENRVLGVKCLSRIIGNITIAELKFHGYGELIYKALEHQLRERDVELAKATIPCIFTLVDKLEKDFGDVTEYHKWSRYDDVLEIVLEAIEMEHLVEIRTIYASQLKCIIEKSGLRIVRWSKRILRLLDHYMDVSGRHLELSSIINCLKALEAFLELADCCGKYSYDDVMFTIFRMIYNLSLSPTSTQECHEALTLCGQCMHLLLQQCSPDEKEHLLISVDNQAADFEEAKPLVTLIKKLLS